MSDNISNIYTPEVIEHGQAQTPAHLDGQSGDIILLQGIAEIHYEWQTKKKAALDLELRASIATTFITPMKSPIVRYRLEFGHGRAVIQHPPIRQPSVSSTPYAWPILPARGLTLRLSARQFRIFFQGGYDTDGEIVAGNKITVSVQPSTASQRLPSPYQQYAINAELQPFPANAAEFRVRRASGRAFFGGACSVTMLGIVDEVLSIDDVAASGFGEWTPIPPMAASLEPDTDCMIEYR